MTRGTLSLVSRSRSPSWARSSRPRGRLPRSVRRTSTRKSNTRSAACSRRRLPRGNWPARPRASSSFRRSPGTTTSTGSSSRGREPCSNGRVVGYYEISSVVYGMQAGVLSFAGALFLMSDDSLRRLDQGGGWEVGKDGKVVVLAAGSGAMPESALNVQTGTLESTGGTMASRAKGRADVYAFVIGETALMTGVDREGWKIVKARLSVAPRFESP